MPRLTIFCRADDLVARRGVIYFGHGSCRSDGRSPRTPDALGGAAFPAVSGFPILAEYSSNMRNFARAADEPYEPLGAYENYLARGCLWISSQVEVLDSLWQRRRCAEAHAATWWRGQSI